MQTCLHRFLHLKLRISQDHNMNFQSKGMTFKDLSIHENATEDTTSHIAQCNDAAGDFRPVTVSVAMCVLPPLPRPTDGGSGGGGGSQKTCVHIYIYIYIYIFIYLFIYILHILYKYIHISISCVW